MSEIVNINISHNRASNSSNLALRLVTSIKMWFKFIHSQLHEGQMKQKEKKKKPRIYKINKYINVNRGWKRYVGKWKGEENMALHGN